VPVLRWEFSGRLLVIVAVAKWRRTATIPYTKWAGQLEPHPPAIFMPRSNRRHSSRTILPGTGPRPDKMLLARLMSYADAQRARLALNHKQISVNRPMRPVQSYSKGGAFEARRVRPGPRNEQVDQ
jgi:catalase